MLQTFQTLWKQCLSFLCLRYQWRQTSQHMTRKCQLRQVEEIPCEFFSSHLVLLLDFRSRFLLFALIAVHRISFNAANLV